MFEWRILMFFLIGLGLIAAVGIERLVHRAPLSLPMVYVLFGWAVFSIPLGLPVVDPVGNEVHAKTIEYLTEFIVIVSLMAAGLAIDRPFKSWLWSQVLPLLIITMPLTITLVAVAGWYWLALSPAAAILLGAALSPTDPVLADSVQVRPPGKSERNDVRFTLTVEAGANDGLAFPFTYLAIAAIGVSGLGNWTVEWFAMDVVWRIFAGVVIGYLVGRVTSWYVFEPLDEKNMDDDDPEEYRRSRNEGLVILGTVLASYGLAEIIEGYGFLAVFVAAITFRQREMSSGYHSLLHRFMDQIEQITLVVMLFGFGGLLAGGILDALTWPSAIIALTAVLVIRPLTGILALLRCSLPLAGRLTLAFAGIRGMGSIYYLAYGQNNGDFSDVDVLWATVALVILISIIVHGISMGWIMHHIEKTNADSVSQHKTETEYQ